MTTTSIPAKYFVDVTPNVLETSAGAQKAIGLFLTTSTQVPINDVHAFANKADVSSYFGPSSDEALAATKYFGGFVNANTGPGSMLFAQYNDAAVSGYLRGGRLSLSLAQLQALTGTLEITVGGSPLTSASIDLSSAASFSAAATTIAAAFTTPGFAVTYDSVAAAFAFTSTATGDAATVEFADGTGTVLGGLKLTEATGAVLSQGAAAAEPATFMDNLINYNVDWATFMTVQDPDDTGHVNKFAFAEWNGNQGDLFMYVCWDTDDSPATTLPASSSLGVAIIDAGISGTHVFHSPDFTHAAFVCGWAASLDFNQFNGRATLAFRSQSGLEATAITSTAANNLTGNGYNFYAKTSKAGDTFLWAFPGSVSGPFDWADSYINQIVFNGALQASLLSLLRAMKSIPYNPVGYGLIAAACLDPINAALNFGTIRANVPLSASQAAEVNAAAGVAIDAVLATRGWYLQVLPASAEVRAARGTPPITIWYMDGQSVQHIALASINVQ